MEKIKKKESTAIKTDFEILLATIMSKIFAFVQTTKREQLNCGDIWQEELQSNDAILNEVYEKITDFLSQQEIIDIVSWLQTKDVNVLRDIIDFLCSIVPIISTYKYMALPLFADKNISCAYFDLEKEHPFIIGISSFAEKLLKAYQQRTDIYINLQIEAGTNLVARFNDMIKNIVLTHTQEAWTKSRIDGMTKNELLEGADKEMQVALDGRFNELKDTLGDENKALQVFKEEQKKLIGIGIYNAALQSALQTLTMLLKKILYYPFVVTCYNIARSYYFEKYKYKTNNSNESANLLALTERMQFSPQIALEDKIGLIGLMQFIRLHFKDKLNEEYIKVQSANKDLLPEDLIETINPLIPKEITSKNTIKKSVNRSKPVIEELIRKFKQALNISSRE